MRWWLFLFSGLLWAQSELGFPSYSAASVANAAANLANFYAPNTILSIYGVNLALNTRALTQADIAGGSLPTVLGSVRVLVNGQFANLLFVSPTQVNVVISTDLAPGITTLQLTSNGKAGPQLRLELAESAPGLFESDGFVIATHGNGPLVTASDPARRGEVLVLYATGLGPTIPLSPINRLAIIAAPLTRRAEFEVRLNGVPVPQSLIEYVGLTPGFAGLYQINVRMPQDAPPDPEIRVGTNGRLSPSGRFLNLR